MISRKNVTIWWLCHTEQVIMVEIDLSKNENYFFVFVIRVWPFRPRRLRKWRLWARWTRKRFCKKTASVPKFSIASFTTCPKKLINSVYIWVSTRQKTFDPNNCSWTISKDGFPKTCATSFIVRSSSKPAETTVLPSPIARASPESICTARIKDGRCPSDYILLQFKNCPLLHKNGQTNSSLISFDKPVEGCVKRSSQA